MFQNHTRITLTLRLDVKVTGCQLQITRGDFLFPAISTHYRHGIHLHVERYHEERESVYGPPTLQTTCDTDNSERAPPKGWVGEECLLKLLTVIGSERHVGSMPRAYRTTVKGR